MTHEVVSRQRRRARERRARKALRRVATGTAGLAALLSGSSAAGATITVNSTADTAATDGQCTLREAMQNARDNAATYPDCAAGSGADTIVFSGLPNPATITLGGTVLPTITDALTITGPGSAALTISGNNASGVFQVVGPASPATDVAITGLSIVGGNTAGSGGGVFAYRVNLTLDGVVVSGNTAQGNGGGVDFFASYYGYESFALRNSTISGNVATGAGGGVHVYQLYGSIYIENDTISGNQSRAFDGGGGVRVELGLGSLAMSNTVVASNSSGVGAAESAMGGGVAVGTSFGGGSVGIADCVIAGNTAETHGSLGSGGGGLALGNGLQATVRRTSFSGNTAHVGGGLLSSTGAIVTLENVTISGNHAASVLGNAYGGGACLGGGPATLVHTTIAGNDAQAGAGGLDVISGTAATLQNALLAGNTAAAGSTTPDVRSGGSVDATYSLIRTPGTATIGGGTGNVTGSDPLLGPLADNGSIVAAGAPGSTQSPKTLLPSDTGPAVNAGNPAFAPPPGTDARGLPRVYDGRTDMGAVESQTVPVTLQTFTIDGE